MDPAFEGVIQFRNLALLTLMLVIPAKEGVTQSRLFCVTCHLAGCSTEECTGWGRPSVGSAPEFDRGFSGGGENGSLPTVLTCGTDIELP